MKHLNKHLDAFNAILNKLDKLSTTGNKCRIGGSMALKLHGLKIPRTPDDLDIIISFPSIQQEEYLQLLKPFNYNTNLGFYDDNQYNFRFKKDGMILNILISYNTNSYGNDLFYKHNDQYYPIAPIEETISAKRKYNRLKDLGDFIYLKNNNFNNQ